MLEGSDVVGFRYPSSPRWKILKAAALYFGVVQDDFSLDHCSNLAVTYSPAVVESQTPASEDKTLPVRNVLIFEDFGLWQNLRGVYLEC
jgi:hypothetical protein